MRSDQSLRGYVFDNLNVTFLARDDIAVAFYFFNSSIKTSMHIISFLRCILHQVVRRELLSPDSQKLLESQFSDQLDRTEPDINGLIELFVHFCKKYKNVFLIIDGLDEADESQQKSIRSFFKNMEKAEGVRMLVLTNPDMDIPKIMYPVQTLQIKLEDVKDDIKTFIQSQIEEHSQEELSICPSSLLTEIKEGLLSGAEEMSVEG